MDKSITTDLHIRESDKAEQIVADAITALVVWYKAPLDKRGKAEAELRRHAAKLLHQPEEVTI